MNDRGQENKRRRIGIREEKISYGWCKWETRGAGRAQQGCTQHLSVQLLYCIIYNFSYAEGKHVPFTTYERTDKQHGGLDVQYEDLNSLDE